MLQAARQCAFDLGASELYGTMYGELPRKRSATTKVLFALDGNMLDQQAQV